MQSGLNLTFIINAFNPQNIDCAKIIAQLGYTDQASVDAALRLSAQQRVVSDDDRHHYIVQKQITENSLSYIFSPFINAVLNYKTIYIAAKVALVEQVYPYYLQLDALELQRQQSIDEMHLGFDLLPADFHADEVEVYALCKALLDPKTQCIYMFAEQGLALEIQQQLQDWAQIEIRHITPQLIEHDYSDINFKQLFWKVKSDESAALCKKIAYANAQWLSQQIQVDLPKAEHLIDDLLYSEHIFEKLSVFGEFTETILKHHRLSTSSAVL
ncbi:hypothetical protein EC844_11328 [Acinetobacter calcoaceticus]|uniref:Uncharacterized protein n=1 Tax=Acinetobacter calcoaceticus TaxID=471 RepID=A0A4V2R0X9_ACICA|nr:hypothetical protein EC844_11328 [Acinetobacter calcoaceticus]